MEDSDCENCGKTGDDRLQAAEVFPRSQIVVKSFDMPSIDCDDQEVEQIVIKQEAEERGYEDYTYKYETTSTLEKLRCQEAVKRHSVEKSHPGIENVVEKLKKNAAAALQEASPRRIENLKEKITDSLNSKKHLEAPPRELENNLKEHILRSCENAQYAGEHEITRESEISSSDIKNSAQDLHHLSKCSTTKDFSVANHLLPRTCYLNDNNNDTRSSNNNIKEIDDEEPVVKKEGPASPDMCEVQEVEFSDSDEIIPNRKVEIAEGNSALPKDNHSSKFKASVKPKQKPSVDLSGLELLSNSIEQLEHLKPDVQNGTSASDLEQSPVKAMLMSPQGENNNDNVDSPLGLLCALAEQRFMEEVGGKVPRKLNLESSEEISHAGRLLLNLGRVNLLEKEDKSLGKRKFAEATTEGYKSFKKFKSDDESEDEESKCTFLYNDNAESSRQCETRPQNDLMFKIQDMTRKSIDFPEGQDTRINDGEESSLKDKPVEKRSPYKNLSYEGSEALEQYDRHYNQYQMNDTYSKGMSAEDNFSDSEAEEYTQKASSEVLEMEDMDRNITRRFSVSEHRDCHEYRNLQAKLEAKKFIARKGHADNDADWPNMDAMELDMRVRLADIQRQYKEKQKELSKLTPKKDEKKSPGRPRKKSHSSG